MPWRGPVEVGPPVWFPLYSKSRRIASIPITGAWRAQLVFLSETAQGPVIKVFLVPAGDDETPGLAVEAAGRPAGGFEHRPEVLP